MMRKFRKLENESMCDLSVRILSVMSFSKNSFPQYMHFSFNVVVFNTSCLITNNDL